MKNVITSRFLSQLALFLLACMLIVSLYHIGSVYINNYAVEYGFHLNMFGPSEGAFYLLYGSLGFFSVLFLSAIRWPTDWFSRLSLEAANINFPRMALILSVATTVFVIVIRFLILQCAPMTDDEHAYLFHAHILKSFKLFYAGYETEIRPFLTNQFLMMGDKAYSQYYPGFPFVLSLGMRLGIVDFINPVLAGMGIYITYLLGSRIGKSAWIGIIGALFLAISPSYLFTSSMLLSHTLTVVLGGIAFILLFRAKDTGSVLTVVFSTILFGGLLFTRPLSGVICGLVGFVSIVSSSLCKRMKLKLLFWIITVALLIGVLFLLYNNLLTGDPLTTTIKSVAEHRGMNRFRFHSSFLHSGSWADLLAFPLLRFNFWAFGWPLSLIFLFLVPKGEIRMLGYLIIFAFWLSHLPWPSVGVNLSGAAHYFETLPWIALLTASSVVHCVRYSNSTIKKVCVSFILFSTIVSIVVFFPWASQNLGKLAERNLKPYVAEKYAEPPAIIFVRSLYRGKVNPSRINTWTYFRKNNTLELTDDILWFNDLGKEKNRIAMERFPNRHYYLIKPAVSKKKDIMFVLKEVYK